MGFGHRVYKNYDPRARIIKKHVDEVLEATEDNPLIEIATELEKQALDDEFFTARKLYPNVDFYSGLIYEALELPTEMFTVMFAIPRTAGWVAQWLEMIDDPRAEDRPARARSTPASATSTTRRSPSARARRRSPTRRCAGRCESAAGPKPLRRRDVQAHGPPRRRGHARELRRPRRRARGARARREGDPLAGAAAAVAS